VAHFLGMSLGIGPRHSLVDTVDEKASLRFLPEPERIRRSATRSREKRRRPAIFWKSVVSAEVSTRAVVRAP